MSDSETQAKKPKMTNPTEKLSSPPEVPIDTTPTCAHFVQRKKRYCKMTVSKGKQFCGEHEPPTLSKHETAASLKSERIPCPLDTVILQ